MGTDWAFYYLTRPTGIALLACGIALLFLAWRLILGHRISVIGYAPLAIGLGAEAVALFLLHFGLSYFEFSARVTNNILPETNRWGTVPGWTVYTFVLSLIYVIPINFLVGIPIAAVLIRSRRLSLNSICAVVVVSWLLLALLISFFPMNDWHKERPTESLLLWLRELALPVAAVAFPFLLGIHFIASRRVPKELP